MKKRKRMRGSVAKVIPPLHPDHIEKAEIDIHDADPLYREVRVVNEVMDDDGNTARLKSGSEVEIVIDATEDATVSKAAEPKRGS